MSVTYTKLFSSITESTIWCESDQTRLVWITMLAMADKYGRVWASIPGLANRARVPVEAARKAVEVLLSPDPDSRTTAQEGRRIEVIDGGWRLINHMKYRAICDDEARAAYKREWDRKNRPKKNPTANPTDADKSDSNPTHSSTNSNSRCSSNSNHSEKDIAAAPLARSGGTAPEPKAVEVKPIWTPDRGWEGITDNLRDGWSKAYPACHIDRQLAAADAWLRANPKKAHKSAWARFMVNWLSRSQDHGGDVKSNNGKPDHYSATAAGERTKALLKGI
jgi:hypothetical protein